MINPDDLDPPRPIAKPLDMQQMSVGELREYIRDLKSEIDRAEKMIESKNAHKDSLAGLFKSD